MIKVWSGLVWQVSLVAWDDDELEPHELFSVRVDPARVALRNPFQEKKWRKFQLTNLFGGFNVASKIHSLDVLLTEDGNQTVDKWLVVQTLGSGHTRDIALDRYCPSPFTFHPQRTSVSYVLLAQVFECHSPLNRSVV